MGPTPNLKAIFAGKFAPFRSPCCGPISAASRFSHRVTCCYCYCLCGLFLVLFCWGRRSWSSMQFGSFTASSKACAPLTTANRWALPEQGWAKPSVPTRFKLLQRIHFLRQTKALKRLKILGEETRHFAWARCALPTLAARHRRPCVGASSLATHRTARLSASPSKLATICLHCLCSMQNILTGNPIIARTRLRRIQPYRITCFQLFKTCFADPTSG